MSPPPLPSAPHAEVDLRQRILDTATQLFADRGYGNASMREVAEGAGCTKPALYYHFGNKEDLFRACVEGCMTTMRPVLDQALHSEGPVRQRLEVFAEGLFANMRENPVRMRLMLGMQTRPDQAQPDVDFARYHEANQRDITALFASGVASGELRADLDLDEAAIALIASLHTRAFLALKGIPAPERAATRIVDLLFRGIAASPSAS